MKKIVFGFCLYAIVFFSADMILYYLNHGNIALEEVKKILLPILLSGLTVIPLLVYLEKRKEKKEK